MANRTAAKVAISRIRNAIGVIMSAKYREGIDECALPAGFFRVATYRAPNELTDRIASCCIPYIA